MQELEKNFEINLSKNKVSALVKEMIEFKTLQTISTGGALKPRVNTKKVHSRVSYFLLFTFHLIIPHIFFINQWKVDRSERSQRALKLAVDLIAKTPSDLVFPKKENFAPVADKKFETTIQPLKEKVCGFIYFNYCNIYMHKEVSIIFYSCRRRIQKKTRLAYHQKHRL